MDNKGLENKSLRFKKSLTLRNSEKISKKAQVPLKETKVEKEISIFLLILFIILVLLFIYLIYWMFKSGKFEGIVRLFGFR
jgi:uncharacterized protein HemY